MSNWHSLYDSNLKKWPEGEYGQYQTLRLDMQMQLEIFNDKVF